MDDAVLNIIIKAVDQASKTASAVGKSFEGMNDRLGKAGERANQIGGQLSTRLTLPILGAGAAAIKLGTDFNAGMANVATLIPGNTVRVNELKNSVQEMAIRTGKSTADLANGLYQTVSAFGDTADTAKILELNAKSAAAGMAETTDAINLTSAVTKGYGDTSAIAVQKASDLALLTVRLGQTTFPELAASIGSVTPLAAGLNVAQEELFGTMATFTGVTGGASEVSTQLRGVLQSLMAPTADTAAMMKRLGYENGQAMIKGEGLQGTIALLVKEAERTGKPLQSFIGSIEGQTLAMAATGGQADSYTEKIKAMSGAAGTTDIAFAEGTEGVNKAGFAMQQARAEVEVMAQKIGDQLAPHIVTLTGYISKLTEWFGKLSPEGQKTVLMVAGILAAIGPALIVIGKMMQGVSALVNVFGVLGKISLLTNPWFLALVAVAALAFLIISNWDTLKGWFSTFWEFVKGIFAAAWEWIKSNWQLVMTLMLGPIGFFVAMVITHWNTIKNAAMAVFNWIKSFITIIINGIIAYFNFWRGVVVGVFNGIKAVAEWVWNLITTIIRNNVHFWGNVIRGIIGVVSNVFSTAVNVVRSIWGGITGFFSGLVGGIGRAFGGVSSAISAPFRGAFNAIAGLWNRSIGNLSFNIPSWVPGIGGKGFSLPKLPMLASGALITGPVVAAIGEGRESEAVLPLSRLERMLEQNQRRALQAVGAGEGANRTTNYNYGDTIINLSTPAAVREYFKMSANDNELVQRGLTPARGGA